MACLDAVSIVNQVAGLKPEWFTFGTSRQQSIAKLKGTSDKLVTGVVRNCKNTLIESIFDLRSYYNEKYGPLRKLIESKKSKIVEKYEKLTRKVTTKSYTAKYIYEMNKNRKEEILVIDTPCLEKYYLARSFCTFDKKVNYSHLIRTYTLSSRYLFKCLDTLDRCTNFKTPVRKPI